ncbi:MAG TPA: hypothetical protein VNL71_25395 [Chloroflexota bacterium]|nr:hypothetical protein [Chloroflexota bacterium]
MALKLPTTTPIPDEILDEWLTELGETELKVLLYIVRRTLGFRKLADAISYKQFLCGIVTSDGRVIDKGCTRNRTGLARALQSLEAKQLIRSRKGKTEAGDDDVTVYALWFEGDVSPFHQAEDPRTQGVVVKTYHRGSQTVPPLVSEAYHGGTNLVPTRNRIPRNRSTTDPDKYFRGVYAVCPDCGSRPHAADCVCVT